MVNQNFSVHVKINSVCVAQDFTCVFQIILAMKLTTNENERPILEEYEMLQICNALGGEEQNLVLSQQGLWARQEYSALIQEPTGKGHMSRS